jgi:zinc/manganese transport system substrate-binding protein
LLSAAPNSHRAVISIADVLHAKNGDNPHFWYDISRLDQITAAIQATYNAQKPDAVQRFAMRTAQLSDSLKPLFSKAMTIKQKYPGAPVAYTERVPGYLLPALSLDNKTPAGFAIAIENGNEPTPADQAAFQDLISNRQVRLVLYNLQAESSVTTTIRTLAHNADVPVVTVTESLPANQTYQAWMEAQLDAIGAALDNTK